jgi:hypothetical protein
LTRADNDAQDHLREPNMIASYKRKSNIGALVFAASMAGSLAVISTSGKNLWDAVPFGPVLGIVSVASYFYALMCLIIGKGRSGAWILMVFLNVLGLIVILLLKDHAKDGTLRPPPQKLRRGWAGDS